MAGKIAKKYEDKLKENELKFCEKYQDDPKAMKEFGFYKGAVGIGILPRYWNREIEDGIEDMEDSMKESYPKAEAEIAEVMEIAREMKKDFIKSDIKPTSSLLTSIFMKAGLDEKHDIPDAY